MRILLVFPPCGPRTIGMRHISRIEPLGLELIGAGVSQKHDVRLVDMMVRPADLMDTLKIFAPDVVGVTTEAIRSRQALAVLRTIRQLFPECLNVVGGHHPTVFPSEFDDPAVDLIVQGEGIDAFAEIVEAHEAGKKQFDHIRGLSIRSDNGLVATEPRPFPATLDDQPFPDRTLTARYRRHYYYITEPSVAGMRTSLGCWHNCSFCPTPLYSQGCYAPRDPKLLFEEIRSIQEPFVFFCDNGSFHDVERMTALAQMLIKAGVQKRYHAYSRTDTIVKHPELFALWRRAGLSMVMLGLEALDDDALRRFNKGTDTSINEEALRFLEKLGIRTCAGFLINPDDRPRDFRRLNRYFRSHRSIVHAEFTPLTPFPGTKYFEAHRDEVLTADWEVYDFMHFVVKTRMARWRLYARIMLSYQNVIRRVIAAEKLWLPHRFFRRHTMRLLRGLVANGVSMMRAGRHVPRKASPADLQRLYALSDQVAARRAQIPLNAAAARRQRKAENAVAENAAETVPAE